MAGQGSVLGSTFEQLRDIIHQVKDKTRIGVCLDTCHLFAGGYDISTKASFDKVLKEFDDIVGLELLMAMHLNDSKGELGCHADRHENLGKGYLGLEAFEYIMNNDVFNDMPLVLETPIGKNEDFTIWQKEIDLLYSLVKDTK
jgi:apurinic endonuclease APN1